MDETITRMDETIVWLEHFGPGSVPVLLTVALLAGASVAVALVKRLLRNWLKRFELHSSLSYGTALTTTRVATAAPWVVVVTLALEVWGIGLGGIWTVVVSLVTVIGVGFLATWTMVSNVTAFYRDLAAVSSRRHRGGAS